MAERLSEQHGVCEARTVPERWWAAGSRLAIIPPQLLAVDVRLDGVVVEMKEGAEGNGCGQTQMAKRKKWSKF